MSPGSRAAHLPPSVGQLLHEFRDSFGFDASVWVREEGGWELALTTGPLHASALPEDAVAVVHEGEMECAVHVAGGDAIAAHAHFLAGVVARALRHEAESRFFGREIAERYEEITLLYSLSEILGSVISLME